MNMKTYDSNAVENLLAAVLNLQTKWGQNLTEPANLLAEAANHVRQSARTDANAKAVHEFLVMHTHRHGVDHGIIATHKQSISVEEAIRLLGWDYEDNRDDEFIDIIPMRELARVDASEPKVAA